MARNRKIDDLLSWMDRALRNARLPQAQEVLAPRKFGLPKIDEGDAKLAAARKEYDEQQAGVGTSRASTRAKSAAWQAASEVYDVQLEAARIVFEEDTARREALGLNGVMPRAFGPWHTRAAQFYDALAADPEAVTLLADEIGESAEAIDAGRALVEAAAQAHAGRAEGSAEGQIETAERDTAVGDLRKWKKKFRRVIDLATRGNPQLRELFGLTEPS